MITANARTVIERRIAAKDDDGNPLETADEVFARVAHAVSLGTKDPSTYETIFLDMLTRLDFIPNSPCLVNAGRELGQLSACFVIPVGDSMEEIFDAVKYTAMIHKSGGGTGFSFGDLRAKGSVVKSTSGVASGPISFMEVFDCATEKVKQGGTRRGANMGILPIDHPDIWDFIHIKKDRDKLQNFNISIAMTDEFMAQIRDEGVGPDMVWKQSGHTVHEIWQALIYNAWLTGDPGLIFIDKINASRANPVPSLGPVKSTNPCVTGDTLILTREGQREIATLEGQYVDVWNGETWSNVLIRETGQDEPILRVKLTNGLHIDCTNYHGFYLADGSYCEAEDLTPGAKLEKFWSAHIDGNYNVERLSAAYALGFFSGDGSISHEEGRSDRSWIFFYGEEKQKIGQALDTRGHVKISALDATRDRLISRFLIEGDRSTVPLHAEPHYQLEWLAGLLDSDGNVCFNGPNKRAFAYQISSVNEAFLHSVALMIRGLGASSAIDLMKHAETKSMPGGIYETQDCYRLTIPSSSAYKLTSLGLPVERLSKMTTKPTRMSLRFPVVASITPMGVAEKVYCFTEPLRNRGVFGGVMTSQCGEQPLYDYDSCNLGSINLANFHDDHHDRGIDWGGLESAIRYSVRFLDAVITVNRYPLDKIRITTNNIRRIGLGVMGWADLLYKLEIPYNSPQAINLAERVMSFIDDTARRESEALAVEYGEFPLWQSSIYANDRPIRNSTRTTIAPTGTISIIAGCSSGIEPVFALAFKRSHHLDRNDALARHEMFEVNPIFEAYAREHGFYSEELIQFLAEGGNLRSFLRADIPKQAFEIFLTAHDLTPEEHIAMQAAFQKHTDNAVSKTINFPNEADVEEVEFAYLEAFDRGCLGITVYRDGSHENQVLGFVEKEPQLQVDDLSEVVTNVSEVIPMVSANGARYTSSPERSNWRWQLPLERHAHTRKMSIDGFEFYLIQGFYPDGTLGETFITGSGTGSTISGLLDTVAMLTSFCLQHGVPVEQLFGKLQGQRFEPAGRTNVPEVPVATSIPDLIARYILITEATRRHEHASVLTERESISIPTAASISVSHMSGMLCPDCQGILAYQEGCLNCTSSTCGYSKCG